MSWKRPLAIGCSVACLAGAGVVGCVTYLLFQQNWALVQHLRLGMNTAEVEAVFGRSPECSTRVGRAGNVTVSYFIDRAWGNENECTDVAAQYEDPSRLPGIYSAVAVAYDTRGRVSAFEHVGEGACHSRVARKPEGSLNSLPLTALE